jgi:hypothetical protein
MHKTPLHIPARTMVKLSLLDKALLFHEEYTKKDFVCQEDFGYKIWVTLLIIV